MNEQQINSGATAPTPNAEQPALQTAATPVQVVVKDTNWTQPAYLLSGVLAVLLAANWWSSQNQISSLREEVARRLLTADTTSSETKILAKNVQETAKEIQTKVILLEGKQSEAQSQQLALEQLYQDLSKNRDEWLWQKLSKYCLRQVSNCNWLATYRGH